MEITVGRTPAQLTEDLRALSDMDWGKVWRGPQGQFPPEWCQQLGWRLIRQAQSGDYIVAAKNGTTWYVRQSLSHKPTVVALEQDTIWKGDARDDQERHLAKETVLAWDGYLTAARNIWGEPSILTQFDAPDFPALSPWADKDIRFEKQSPLKLAVWHPAQEEDPRYHLWINRSWEGQSTSIRGTLNNPHTQQD